MNKIVSDIVSCQNQIDSFFVNQRIALLLTRYIMLAVSQRTTKDPRTLGSLFHAGCDELRQVSFAEALAMLLGLFKQVLMEIPTSIAGRIQALLDSFVAEIPAMLQRMLLIPAWKY